MKRTFLEAADYPALVTAVWIKMPLDLQTCNQLDELPTRAVPDLTLGLILCPAKCPMLHQAMIHTEQALFHLSRQ
jgi:hypothetical protein